MKIEEQIYLVPIRIFEEMFDAGVSYGKNDKPYRLQNFNECLERLLHTEQVVKFNLNLKMD